MQEFFEILKLCGITIVLILSFTGCFVPILPGPILAWLSIFLLSFLNGVEINNLFLWGTGIFAIFITILDYFIPIWGTKKFGGSKYGIWGSIIGFFAGIIFTPIGMFFGMILGAFIGEYINDKDINTALKSAMGTIIGFVISIFFKLGFCITMAYYFLANSVKIFKYIFS